MCFFVSHLIRGAVSLKGERFGCTMPKWLGGTSTNGCKIFGFLFHVIVYFLAFREAGLGTRQRMDIRLSRVENKAVVYRKIS